MTVDRAYAALARLAPMALRFDSSTAKEFGRSLCSFSDHGRSASPQVSDPLMVRPGGMGLGQFVDDFFARIPPLACWVAVATGAHAVLNIENKIVTRAWSYPHRYRVQSQGLPGFPGDYVVGARRVSADSEGPHNSSIFVVKGQTAAKDDDSSNWLSYQGVIGLAELFGITGKRSIWIWTSHDAVKRVSRLGRRKNIAAGESKIIGAESVCRVRLFGGDQTASWPFRSSIRSGKNNGTDDAIAIHYRAPFLISESSIRPFSLFDGAR
jgi:hypothetical protein